MGFSPSRFWNSFVVSSRRLQSSQGSDGLLHGGAGAFVVEPTAPQKLRNWKTSFIHPLSKYSDGCYTLQDTEWLLLGGASAPLFLPPKATCRLVLTPSCCPEAPAAGCSFYEGLTLLRNPQAPPADWKPLCCCSSLLRGLLGWIGGKVSRGPGVLG